MSVASEIKKATVAPIFLLEVTAALWVHGLVQHSGFVYKFPTSLNVVAVKQDTTTRTQVNSVTDCINTPGSWFHDGSTLYVNTTDANGLGATWQASIKFHFASRPKIFNEAFYDPRVKTVPALSIRIEPRFSGVGQIGGGNCTLINSDKFFDSLDSLYWDNGTAVFKMGIDTPQAEMPYADYVNVGTWRVDGTETTGDLFTLKLRELKTNLEKSIPLNTFTREAYPQIDKNAVGQPIPLAYGTIYGAKPILIDTAAKRLKVADHAILCFLEARAETSQGVWTRVNFVSTDNANAEFTLGADWNGSDPLSVDFCGRKTSAGKLMTNPSDVVKDILSIVGESNLASASFTKSYSALKVGAFDTGEENTLFKPSLYISSTTPALRVIGEVNRVAGSFLYIDFDGKWHYEVFTPQPGSVVAHFTDTDILEGSFKRIVDVSRLYSKVNVRFAQRLQEDWAELVTHENTRNQYLPGEQSRTLEEVSAPLFDKRDTSYFAQRLLRTEALPLIKYQFDIPWQAFLLLPGHQVRVSWSRFNLDSILEVLEVKHDLLAGRVNLVLGDRRGFGDSFGFWMGNTEPVWNAAWTDSEKIQARQNAGYWTDSQGLANATDGKSDLVSRWW